MFYEDLFSTNKKIKACLMGAGEFGAAFVTQAKNIPNLDLIACCSLDVNQAIDAFVKSGINKDDIAIANSTEQALSLLKENKKIVCDNFEYICSLGADVLIESSGAPIASAKASLMAIENKMHVVVASKETESVVGPILARKAIENNVVYTCGDGDQPSILIGLISWAKVLGLKIVAAGKSSEYDFVYDPKTKQLHCNGQNIHIECPELDELWDINDRSPKEIVKRREALLSKHLSLRSNPDLCEMCLVSNATGLKFDKPQFNAPIARINELADIFCNIKDEGVLNNYSNTLDIFNCLRKPDELSMAGGEFIIVECTDKNIWSVLEAKGHIVSKNKKYACIYIPRHIMGLEIATSVMAAAIMNHSTAGKHVKPVTDMYAIAKRDLKAGTIFKMGGHHHTIEELSATTGDSQPIADNNPVPFYMLGNATLVNDVKEGSLIKFKDIRIENNNILVTLRKEQDQIFL